MPLEKKGNKFLQIDLEATGGDYEMSELCEIKEVRLTNIAVTKTITFDGNVTAVTVNDLT